MDSSNRALIKNTVAVLFICSAAALFWELTLIRWLSSTIRIVAYYSNFVLISAFFGLGVGALSARFKAEFNIKNYLTILILACFILFPDRLIAEMSIRCATTTSLQNSGLLERILPLFKQKTGIRVDVVAVGSGAAIEIGKRGDADFVFAHARDLELKAVQEGYFINRMEFMYNDFVIVGPGSDPSRVKGLKKASEGFDKISKSGGLFISRGDNSGTHVKELSIWKEAGIDPKGQLWYLESGQGMSKTLRLASEKLAYTITDRSTWLASRDKPQLALLSEGDPALINYYSVMAVNPQKNPAVKYKEAMEFISWLTSKEGTEAIKEFKDSAGNQLFYIKEKK